MSPENLPLIHLAQQPRVAGATPPLLVLLHGYGANEHDLFNLATYLDERFLVLSVRAPLPLMPGAYAWFEIGFTSEGIAVDERQADQSRKTLAQFVADAPAAYGADPERVFVAGFSQGATMAALVGLTQPELVAGTIAMSGIVPVDLLPTPPDPTKLNGRPFLLTHGTLDSVVPIAHGRASRAMLAELPVALTYHEYSSAHEISLENLRDVAVWLAERLSYSGNSGGI